MQGNCLIVQSGGPTAVINNSMVGIIDEIINSDFSGTIFGSVGGIHGLLNESFITLNNLSINDRYRLRWTPGAALGTWRYKLTEIDLERILTVLRKSNIRYLFYIGGNGSMKVAEMIYDFSKAISYELYVVGVPKSIDNDVLGTDHSPGYGSAAKFLATSVLDVKMDMASYIENNRVTIIETMGRHSGWLAAACSMAEDSEDVDNDLLIYIPEVPFNLYDCLDRISKANEEKRSTIIVVAEGIRNTSGHLVNANNRETDTLGRPKLGGISTYLKNIVEKKTNIETRIISSSIWQRSSIYLASKTDVNEAYRIGREASIFASKKLTGVMVSMRRQIDKDNYGIVYETIPLKEIAGNERLVPIEWYDTKGNTMTNTFKEYISPIIQGEMFIPMENGLPVYKRRI